MALLDRQAANRSRGLAERALECVTAGTVPNGRLPDSRDIEGDRLRAKRQPGSHRRRPGLLKDLSYLGSEAVRVVELHHPAASPVPLWRRSAVALNDDDVIAAGLRGHSPAADQLDPPR